MTRETIPAYIWTSDGKTAGGETDDDITCVILDVDGSTVKTAIFKGVEESVNSAVASVFATCVEIGVGNAIGNVLAREAELKVGNTEVGVIKGTMHRSCCVPWCWKIKH